MGRIKALLAAPFQRGVGGDERAVLEDADDRIGEDVDVEDPTSRRVRHAVEIAADAGRTFVRRAPLQWGAPPDMAGEGEALARAFPRRRPR